MNSPETRPSLLLRIRDPSDDAAWVEFSTVYRPVIIRLARQKGMQLADAEDLAQQVLLSISKAIERWEPDGERAKFRTWLRRVATNAILNAVTRGVPDRSAGDEETRELLEQHPATDGPDSNLLRLEYRRQVFLWAAQKIRIEFSDETWNSFWFTAVDGLDVDDAAQRIERSRGSVYASRSRVMRRLTQQIDEFDG